MPRTLVLTRRQTLQSALACGLAATVVPARACEFFTSTLRVLHPWTRASGPGASSAIVSLIFDEVTQSDRLLGAQTPVADSVQLVRAGKAGPVNLSIPAGQVTELAETGVHLRLVGLKQPMQIGRTYPLDLLLESGGTVQASLSVDYQRFL